MFDRKAYMRRYRKIHKNEVRYIDDKCAARRFTKNATDSDLNWLVGLINKRKARDVEA